MKTAQLVGSTVLLVLALVPEPVLRAQEIRWYVSSLDGERLAARPPLQFGSDAPGLPGFFIDDQITHQTIAGFGASFLEAGMVCLNSLAPAEQERVLAALFDPARGAGFSAMKTPLAGTDFMSAGPWYTYDDTPGDVALEHFSIARDLGPNGLVTFIQRARHYGSFLLQAPMDYPPDWMLVDVRTNQDVNPQCYGALARYYLRYLQEYQHQGIAIDYLSLFNEPGVYTKIRYDEIRNLLKDYVAPLLTAHGSKTRLQLSEAPNRESAARDYPILLDDPEARQCVASIPYHGYDLGHFDGIAGLGRRYPELPLWMTELCYAYEAGTPKSMKLPRADFADGDFWGQQIFSDLEAGASAWIYWNLILDEKGGPWLVSPIHGNPEDNIQHPVVIINRQSHEVTYTGLYYYLAHFSKFVRPGAIRLGTRGVVPGVRALAFRTQAGAWVTQLLNSRGDKINVALHWHDRAVTVPLPANSIASCLWGSNAPGR